MPGFRTCSLPDKVRSMIAREVQLVSSIKINIMMVLVNCKTSWIAAYRVNVFHSYCYWAVLRIFEYYEYYPGKKSILLKEMGNFKRIVYINSCAFVLFLLKTISVKPLVNQSEMMMTTTTTMKTTTTTMMIIATSSTLGVQSSPKHTWQEEELENDGLQSGQKAPTCIMTKRRPLNY